MSAAPLGSLGSAPPAQPARSHCLVATRVTRAGPAPACWPLALTRARRRRAGSSRVRAVLGRRRRCPNAPVASRRPAERPRAGAAPDQAGLCPGRTALPA